MHILASGVNRILSAFSSLVFLCVIDNLANSYVHSYPTKSGLSEHRVPIERLRMIAKRLTDDYWYPLEDDQTLTTETLAFDNSMTESIGTALNTADERDETGDLHDFFNPFRKQNLHKVLNSVYRQSSSGPLENFRNTYTDLYNVLLPFLDQFIQHLKPGANGVLRNAALIPSVLRPYDRSFANEDWKDLMKKFSVVEQVLQALLDNGQEYVQDGYKPTFTSKAKIIDYKLRTAKFAALSLPFHKEDSNVSILPCGISCINTGVKPGMNYDTLKKLHTLGTFLVNKGRLPPKRAKNVDYLFSYLSD